MINQETDKFDENSIEKLQTKVTAFSNMWRISITCMIGTMLGYIALSAGEIIIFILALLPFPMVFTLQIYERRLDKALYDDIRRKYMLRKMGNKDLFTEK